MSKYANTPKTGSTNVRTYDPKTTSEGGGGGKPPVTRKYKPVGNNTPKAPGRK